MTIQTVRSLLKLDELAQRAETRAPKQPFTRAPKFLVKLGKIAKILFRRSRFLVLGPRPKLIYLILSFFSIANFSGPSLQFDGPDI